MKRERPDNRVIREVAARALGGSIVVEPVEEGVSTYVYRLLRGGDVFYLRVLPEDGAAFAPEAEVHAILRRHGVLVPKVVYWDDRNQIVHRSVMITTEIKGTGIRHDHSRKTLPSVLRAAGRDLAVLNRLPVDGFGWIRRDVAGDGRLRGELATEREFMLAQLEDDLRVLDDSLLDQRHIDSIRGMVRDHDPLLDASHACLAHGDFDATHIFCHQGRYTGIIDFGEIRGTGSYYDLGHFRFHDGETVPITLLLYLLEGYAEVAPFTGDTDLRIALDSLLIGIRYLARTCGRLARHNQFHARAAIERGIGALLS